MDEEIDWETVKSELQEYIHDIEHIKPRPQSRLIALVPIQWHANLVSWLKGLRDNNPGPVDTSCLLSNGTMDLSKQYRIDFQIIEASIWDKLTRYFPCSNPIMKKFIINPSTNIYCVVLNPIVLEMITPEKAFRKTTSADWPLADLKRPLCLAIHVISSEHQFYTEDDIPINENMLIGDYYHQYGSKVKLGPSKQNISRDSYHLKQTASIEVESPQKLSARSASSSLIASSKASVGTKATFNQITSNSTNSKPFCGGRVIPQAPTHFSNSTPQKFRKNSTVSTFSSNRLGSAPNSNSSFDQPIDSASIFLQTFGSRFNSYSPSPSALPKGNLGNFMHNSKSVPSPLPMGLLNLGNTCFFNAALQCILRVPPLYNFMLSDDFTHCLNSTNPQGSGGAIANEYRALLENLSQNHGTFCNPSSLKSAISNKYKIFNNMNQHDAHEVLGAILNGLHEDLNELHRTPDGLTPRSNSRFKANPTQQFSIIGEIFYFVTTTTTKCPKCLFFEEMKEPQLFLELSLPDSYRTSELRDLIGQFFTREELNQQNLWTCEKCKEKVAASRGIRILKVPQVLIIHLKRFCAGNFGTMKVETPVNYPDEIPVSWISQQCNGKYVLQSVVFHVGSLNGGHYTAAGFDPGSKLWYKYNDSEVTEIRQSLAHSPNAYILFYMLQ